MSPSACPARLAAYDPLDRPPVAIEQDAADAYMQAVSRRAAPWDRFFEYGPDELRVFYVTRGLAALQISPGEYRALFGTNVLEDFAGELAAVEDERLIEVAPEAIRPTPRGMFYADTIASVFARRRLGARLGEAAAQAQAARAYADDNGRGHM